MNRTVRSLVTLAALVALCTTAGSQDATTSTRDRTSTLSVSISAENGRIRQILINGEKVPDSRIIREGKDVTILDGDGKPVTKFQLLEGGRIVMDRSQWSFPSAPDWNFPTASRLIIGIHMGTVDRALAEHLGIDGTTCMVVTDVLPDYPAQKAGVQKFDIITHLNGRSPATPEKLRELLLEKKPGETVNLRLLRKGQSLELTVGTKEYELPTVATPGMKLWSDKNLRFDSPGNDTLKDYFDALPKLDQNDPQALPTFRYYEQGLENRQKRLEKLEERLARLEKLLRKLVEDRERKL